MSIFLKAPGAVSVPGVPGIREQQDLDLWNQLASLPIYPIHIPTTTASKQLETRRCMIVGISLRETSGTAAAQVELINGADATGEIVAEVTLPAPLPGSVGNTDTDVTASGTAAAGAMAPALPGVAGQTTFLTGFEVTGTGATASSTVAVTVTGLISSTPTYYIVVPAGAALEIVRLLVELPRPVPASGLNTAITLNVPSFGAGNLQASATIRGFQRTVGSTSAQTGVSIPQNFPTPGVLCRSGLFMRVITGSVVGSAWVRV